MKSGKLLYLALVFTLFLTGPLLAEDTSESAKAFLEGYSELLNTNFPSSQSFGNPINAGDYVVIPVVCKMTAFGFGTKLAGKEIENNSKEQAKSNSEKNRMRLGGGVILKPVALIFIKNNGEFNVVNLNEGFFSQLGKSIAPAMASMVKATVKSLLKHKLHTYRSKDKKSAYKDVRKRNKPAKERQR